MSQPTPFNRTADYSADELANVAGRSTLRTAALDAELDALQVTLSEVLANLAQLQTDEGNLQEGSVTQSSLSTELRVLLSTQGGTPRGLWVTGTVYALRDIVTQAGSTYLCAAPHTAEAEFATDQSAGRWLLLAAPPGTLTAAATAFTPAGGISASNVQAAIAELDTEKASKDANLSDLQSPSAALANLGGLPLSGGILTGELLGMRDPRSGLEMVTARSMLGALAGLQVSVSGTSLTVQPGVTCDDLGEMVMRLTSAMAKAINAGWAAGSTSGGVDSGSLLAANGTTHVFVIGNPSTGAVDVLLGSSLTPTMPAGFTRKRRIASLANGPNVAGLVSPYAFAQRGDLFVLEAPITFYSGTAQQSMALTDLVRFPQGLELEPILWGYLHTGTAGVHTVWVAHACQGLAAPSTAAKTGVARAGLAGQSCHWCLEGGVITNTSRQIGLEVLVTGGTLLNCTAAVRGWRDQRLV